MGMLVSKNDTDMQSGVYDIDELVSNMNFSSHRFVCSARGLMLTNYEIDVLKKYHIEYEKCSSLKDLLYQIEAFFSDSDGLDLEDLDMVSSSIAERDYYQNVHQ